MRMRVWFEPCPDCSLNNRGEKVEGGKVEEAFR